MDELVVNNVIYLNHNKVPVWGIHTSIGILWHEGLASLIQVGGLWLSSFVFIWVLLNVKKKKAAYLQDLRGPGLLIQLTVRKGRQATSQSKNLGFKLQPWHLVERREGDPGSPLVVSLARNWPYRSP